MSCEMRSKECVIFYFDEILFLGVPQREKRVKKREFYA